MELVKSSDVLDATHEAKRPFSGGILGYFRRVGPNAWDDYQFVPSTTRDTTGANGEPSQTQHVDVLPMVPLQLEAHGPIFRMRSAGRVVRVRWLPTGDDRDAMGDDAEPQAVRHYFVDQYLSPLGAVSEFGAAAVVARKLSDP